MYSVQGSLPERSKPGAGRVAKEGGDLLTSIVISYSYIYICIAIYIYMYTRHYTYVLIYILICFLKYI